MTGETPQVHGGGFPGEPCLELSVTGGGEQVGAIRLGDLRELLLQADAHGVDDSRAVIFEEWTREGAVRVRATGAGVRVPVKESSLRPAEPASASLGTVKGETPGEYARRAMLEAKAEAWGDGFEAASEWVASNPGPRGGHTDPPRNPHELQLGTAGVVNPADLGPAERFADLGGVIPTAGVEGFGPLRKVRDEPQA